MTAIIMAVGVFYMLAAAFVLRRACMEWLLDHAIEKRAGTPEPDRHRLLFMSASAFLYGGAGFALVLGSAAAVWFLGMGLLVQGLYYGLFRRNAAGSSDADGNSQRQAWNAAIISTAAFALAAYALKAGVLT